MSAGFLRAAAVAGSATVLLAETQAGGVQVFEANPNLAIPDVGIISFDLTVPADPLFPVMADLDVGLVIPHTWQGDLKLTLTHVDDGLSAVLFDRPGAPQITLFGFSADNYGHPASGAPFVLNDEAVDRYDAPPLGPVPAPGIPNVTGDWLPESPLSVFAGTLAAGTWRLTIQDHAGGDVGILQTLSLRMTLVPEPASALGVGVLALVLTRRGGRRDSGNSRRGGLGGARAVRLADDEAYDGGDGEQLVDQNLGRRIPR